MMDGDDLAYEVDKLRWLALTALLMRWLMPVPTPMSVGSRRLCRVQNRKACHCGCLVHPGPGGEVVWILGASMKH
jgi:hypothetical protein